MFAIDVEKYYEEDMNMASTTDSSMMYNMTQTLHIESTLDIDWDSFWQQSSTVTAANECYPKFKLYVQVIGSDNWKLWSERETELTDLGLEGGIWFSDWGSYVEISFSTSDVDLLVEKYWDQDAEKAFIQFRTVALVPGSYANGPETDLDELAHSDWKLNLVSRDTSLDCASSTIVLNDLDVSGEYRDYIVAFEVQASGTTPIEPMVVPLREVVTTVKGCPVETVIEYEDNDGYHELRDNDYITIDVDPEVMTVTMMVSAERYIDDLVPSFSNSEGGYIPDYIYIPVTVTTYDSNGNSVTDHFSLEITGSGQTKASVCDWSLLTVSDLMAD
jgi:hypothetical protein